MRMIRHGDRVALSVGGNREGSRIADAVDPVSTTSASNPWMVRTRAPLVEASQQNECPIEWACLTFDDFREQAADAGAGILRDSAGHRQCLVRRGFFGSLLLSPERLPQRTFDLP